MIIDGIAASEAIDSSGEILDVEGCDISDLENGVGVLNWEHRGEDAAGASANDIIGKITFAKKIFARSDCDNDRERMYWDRVKLPYIYIKCRLFDGAGHPGAIAAAAMIRDYEQNSEPILVRYSIEGSTLQKDGNRLKRCIARRVAATIKPCNKSCHSGLLEDPNSPTGEKPKDPLELDGVEKKEFEHPSFMRLGGDAEIECSPWVRDLVEVENVQKTLTAGSYDVAPSHLTGGAALQVEDPERHRKKLLEMYKNQVKAAVRDWDGMEPLKQFLKFRLPETDPAFIDRFADLVEDYKMKKAEEEKLPAMKTKAPAKKPAKAKKAPAQAAPLQKLPGREMPVLTPPAAKRPPKEAVYKPTDIKGPTPVKLGSTVVKDANGKRVEKKILVGQAHQHLATHLPGPRATPKSNGDSYFDEQSGILHTHVGSFKMNIPSDAEYQKILNDPEISHHHDQAVKQWKTLHKLLKQGKLPQEIPMHAALFSAMSPSVGVPYQEFGYSHLVDLMNNHGMDPSKPGGVTPAHRQEFMSRVIPGANKYPEHEQEHWKGPAGDPIRLKNDQKAKGLKAGDTGGLFGPDSKFQSVIDYHHLHKHLTDMISRHGSNVGAMASELLQHKAQAKLFNSRKENKEQDNAYQEQGHGPSVDGFANKTVRYLLGMMGGGNVHVPDTHYIRHTFGLPQDDEIIEQAKKELGPKWDDNKHIGFAPNDALKGILWKPHNNEIGEAMDRYYMAHHPAAKHVKERHFSKPDEDGFQWDDDAHVFPAFWKHWLSIEPHEQSQGKRTDHQNAGTDHRVYWNAVNSVLKKYGLPHNEMIKSEQAQQPHNLERIAQAHAHINRMFGESAGNFFYYHSLVPMLLNESRKREAQSRPETMVRKFEALVITLRKAMADAGVPLRKGKEEDNIAHELGDAYDNAPAPARVKFKGFDIEPGVVRGIGPKVKGKHFHLIHADDNHVVVTPFEAGIDGPRRKWKAGLEGTHFVTTKPHKVIGGSAMILDHEKHGAPDMHYRDEQRELLHGTDFSQPELYSDSVGGGLFGVNADRSHWRKMGNGKPAYLKMASDYQDHEDFSDARKEAMYSNLAHVMGMGQYVPNVGVFKHPVSKKEHAAIEVVDGGRHYDYGDEHRALLKHHGESGELDKLALMNMIMGNQDRHSGNWLMTSKGPKMIDHGYAFSGAVDNQWPHYWDRYHDENGVDVNSPLHPEATKWVESLDPDEVKAHMHYHGAPDEISSEVTRRIQNLKHLHKTFGGALNKSTAFFMPQNPNYDGPNGDDYQEEDEHTVRTNNV